MWKDDQRIGKGVFYYANGDKFDGEWTDNRKGADGNL